VWRSRYGTEVAGFHELRTEKEKRSFEKKGKRTGLRPAGRKSSQGQLGGRRERQGSRSWVKVEKV